MMRFPDFRVLEEPLLRFDPVDRTQTHIHPLRGLLQFGPYSSAIVGAVPDPIRCAAIGPAGEGAGLVAIIKDLEAELDPSERHQYLPRWPGFRRVFHRDLRVLPRSRNIQLSHELDIRLQSVNRPHRFLAEALCDAIHQLYMRRSEFDLVIIYLPIRWKTAFNAVDEEFDLHDFVKGTTASLGIPSQIVLESTATSNPNRASIAWALGIGIYAKVGGTPWKLAATDERVAFIGISYALRRDAQGGSRFVTCCSQIFDSEGGMLEFVAYQMAANRVSILGHNPFLSRDQMRAVISQSLVLYLERHAGVVPERVVVHKSTEFKKSEVEGCWDALERVNDVELLQIQDNTPWRAVQVEPDRRSSSGEQATAYPTKRGTLLYLGDYEALLWTQGNAPEVAFNGRGFFKEGVGIPRPILLRRWAGSMGAEAAASEVLALTKMNWNNDDLYDTLPTTLGYASTLAKVIKTMPSIESGPYSYRLFM